MVDFEIGVISLSGMNKDEAQQIVDEIKSWSLPFVNAYVSTLGNADRASAMVTVSLDKKEEWHYGILENSRYAKFAVHSHGAGVRFEHFSGYKIGKMRGWSTALGGVSKKLSALKEKLEAQVTG